MYTGNLIQDLSATVDRALSPSLEPPESSAVHAEEVRLIARAKDYDTLITERRSAAFAMVGAVSALVFIARQNKQPIDCEDLQKYLDRYDAADKALDEFHKATV